MMYFRDREEQDNAAKKIIEDYRAAAALCAKIKPVIAAFNGKVYNCRFDKKIAEIDRIFCKKTEYNFCIYIYTNNHYNHQLTLCSLPVDKAINNKRLQADLLIASCNVQREKYLKKAYELKQQLIYIDLYKKRFEELKREVENLNNSIPYEFKSIYELNYNLRRG